MAEQHSYSKIGWNLQHSYQEKLPKAFYSASIPETVPRPRMAVFNTELAKYLGLNNNEFTEKDWINWLSGNELPPNSQPIAQAYAGHQFGHFTMLGDGRAILLGEQRTPENELFDIQLKGAGKTIFSRGGDGKGTLKAMLREYLISEAMHGLGIPTSRSLAVVRTGEAVQREWAQEGAVLTRVMSSHLRIGTFEFARQFQPIESLEKLCDYAIRRHYPHVLKTEFPVSEFLKAVMKNQIELVVNWWRVGFIHGVMNTDNTGIAGATYDYGPCAFMNAFNLKTVYSSIDRNARYAFGDQPGILKWNLSCLAGALLPLIHTNEKIAIDKAKEILNEFDELFNASRNQMLAKKIGFDSTDEQVITLVNELLVWMNENHADYTNTFLFIEGVQIPNDEVFQRATFKQWHQKWQNLIQNRNINPTKTMKYANPTYIPRNNKVEEALDFAAFRDDWSKFNELLSILQNPYTREEIQSSFTESPDENFEAGFRTFCGT